MKTLKTDWDLGACTKRNSARKIYKSVIWQGQERQHLDSLRTQRRHTEKEKDREYKCESFGTILPFPMLFSFIGTIPN